MTIEKINEFEKRFKEILIGIFALFLVVILPDMKFVLFNILGLDVNNFSITFRVIYLIVFEITVMLSVILLFYNTLKDNFYDMIKNHKDYYHKYFKYYLIGLAVMMGSNLIIFTLFNGSIAGNEQSIRATFKVAPLYIYLSAIIYAPIVEELAFRQGIRNIFKNKYLFILVSGILFGSMHLVGNVNVWSDILYVIPYSALGVAFAYIFYKTKNIFVTMGLHFMHNGILMALQIFILLFS